MKRAGYKLNYLTLCIALLFAGIEGFREKRTHNILNKFVSKEVASEILKKGHDHLGGREQEVAVLFADIRGFTHMTEDMPPTEVIQLLNDCITLISPIIEENGGVIDKYVGDEVMVIFGAPICYEDKAFKAVKTAIEIMQVLQSWNQERSLANQPMVEMGIGVHLGTVVAGNMGCETRLNYTVLGANVNLAARLCSSAGPSEILTTDSVLQNPQIKYAVHSQPLTPMHFKGFSKDVNVYKILW